ncbi:MAG: protein-glutamate O-methyltransferase CheR [Acidimicrobiia bacterium]
MTSIAEQREFAFDRRHFQLLRTVARDEAGIDLNDSKDSLVYGRVVRRIRELGLSSFDEYCALVAAKRSSERSEFINCITTNVTAFFREPHHFSFLRDEALPELMAERAGSRRLRLWSAACSTGQEPYSLAMTVADAVPDTWDCKILATDIDSNVVAYAERGVYTPRELAGVGPEHRRWFRPADEADPSAMQISPKLQRSMYFRVLNLMEPWPMRGPLDVIFCRNVIIYFSAETQHRLIDRFAQLLAPDGYLVIGHSESILHAPDRFEALGRTIYRRRRT